MYSMFQWHREAFDTHATASHFLLAGVLLCLWLQRVCVAIVQSCCDVREALV